MGGADPEEVTKDDKMALDLFFEWLQYIEQHNFFTAHAYQFKRFIRYMWDAGGGCTTHPAELEYL